MAAYKYEMFLEPSSAKMFDEVHPAGRVAPESGVYRCDLCPQEIATRRGRKLPGWKHKLHADKAPRWKLAVQAVSPPP